jgi:hypothetical protein
MSKPIHLYLLDIDPAILTYLSRPCVSVYGSIIDFQCAFEVRACTMPL